MKKNFFRLAVLTAALPFCLLISCSSGGGEDTGQSAFDKLKGEKKAVLDKICSDLGALKSKLDAMGTPGKEIVPVTLPGPPLISLNDDKSNVWVVYYPDLGNAIEKMDPHYELEDYKINMAGNQVFNNAKRLYNPEIIISADFKAETEALNNFDISKAPYMVVLKNPQYLPVEISGEVYNGGGMTIEVYLVNTKTMEVITANTITSGAGLAAGYDKKGGEKAIKDAINRTSREGMTMEIYRWLDSVTGK